MRAAASPKSVRGCGLNFKWKQRLKEKYKVWLFIKAGKGSSGRSKARLGAMLCRSGQCCGTRERQTAKCCWAGSRVVSWAGYGELGHRFPVWIQANSLLIFLSAKREDRTALLPWMQWSLIHGGPTINSLANHMNTAMCNWSFYLQCVYTVEGILIVYTLFSFVLDLLVRASYTWYLLPLESSIVTSVWHWA